MWPIYKVFFVALSLLYHYADYFFFKALNSFASCFTLCSLTTVAGAVWP